MIRKSFNFLFWGGIISFFAYTASNHFDSFEIANTQFQEEKFEEADTSISKYNNGTHRLLRTVNGYILQSEISNQLDRFYVGKKLANHALTISKEANNNKAICLSQNALQKSKLLIGDLTDIEIPLLDCLTYFKKESNDFDRIKTYGNLSHYYMLTNNKNYLSYFLAAEKIVEKKDTLEYLMVDFYVNKMFYHIKRNENDLAIEMISKATAIHKKHFSKQISKLAYLKTLSAVPMIGMNNLHALEFIHNIMQDKSLKLSVSMKIHILLIMGQIYKNLEDYNTSLTFDLKSLELLNTFPTKEVHAIETALVYKSMIQNYQKIGNFEMLNKTKSMSQSVLKDFPEVKQYILN